jgi:ABC-2 type transport system permease protein
MTVQINNHARFADALNAEWTKFLTLRSFRYILITMVPLALGMAILLSSGTGESYGDLTAKELSEFDPTRISLQGGIVFAQVAIGLLGALMVTSEYGTGMMRTSLTVVPRRVRLLAAKAVLTTAISFLSGLAIGFAAFLLGQSSLAETGAPHATLGQPHVLRAIVGAGLYLMLVGLLGVAVGFLVRSTAAALVVLVVTVLIIPLMVGPFLPPVLGFLWPVVAGTQILATTQGGAGPWAGFAVMCMAVAATLAAALAAFRYRDA